MLCQIVGSAIPLSNGNINMMMLALIAVYLKTVLMFISALGRMLQSLGIPILQSLKSLLSSLRQTQLLFIPLLHHFPTGARMALIPYILFPNLFTLLSTNKTRLVGASWKGLTLVPNGNMRNRTTAVGIASFNQTASGYALPFYSWLGLAKLNGFIATRKSM